MNTLTKSLFALGLGVAVVTASTSAFAAEPTRNKPQLTDAQKQIFEQIKTLKQEGKTDEAKQLAKDNNLPGMIRGGKTRGKHPEPTAEQKSAHEAVKKAIEANDYNAFVAATNDTPFADKITADTFAKMAQAHQLIATGKDAEARELMKNSGFLPPHKHGKMQHAFKK